MIRRNIWYRFLVIAVFAFLQKAVHGFADWMTKDFCDRSLEKGEVIMNSFVEESAERFVQIFRGTVELASGELFKPGEMLTVRVDNESPQFVFEIKNGYFPGGGCHGRRIANKNNVDVMMPMEDEAKSDVSIWIGWAPGHNAVKISAPFILKSPIESNVTFSNNTTEVNNIANTTALNNTAVIESKEVLHEVVAVEKLADAELQEIKHQLNEETHEEKGNNDKEQREEVEITKEEEKRDEKTTEEDDVGKDVSYSFLHHRRHLDHLLERMKRNNHMEHPLAHHERSKLLQPPPRFTPPPYIKLPHLPDHNDPHHDDPRHFLDDPRLLHHNDPRFHDDPRHFHDDPRIQHGLFIPPPPPDRSLDQRNHELNVNHHHILPSSFPSPQLPHANSNIHPDMHSKINDINHSTTKTHADIPQSLVASKEQMNLRQQDHKKKSGDTKSVFEDRMKAAPLKSDPDKINALRGHTRQVKRTTHDGARWNKPLTVADRIWSIISISIYILLFCGFVVVVSRYRYRIASWFKRCGRSRRVEE